MHTLQYRSYHNNWGGIIKRYISFILIILFSLNLTLYLFPKDNSSDEEKLTESQYFNKVKSVMGVKDTEVDSKNDKQKKKAINIGYFSYIKIILVLGLVILAIYVIYQFMRKFLKIKGDIGEESAVIVNQAVGPGKWVQVVYIAGKYLILGISNENVSLLTEVVDKKEIEHLEILLNEKRSQEGENFIDIISDFFKNTLKKTFNKEKFDYEEDSVDFLKEQKDRIDKMKKRN